MDRQRVQLVLVVVFQQGIEQRVQMEPSLYGVESRENEVELLIEGRRKTLQGTEMNID